jgi:hypothetical protein
LTKKLSAADFSRSLARINDWSCYIYIAIDELAKAERIYQLHIFPIIKVIIVLDDNLKTQYKIANICMFL